MSTILLILICLLAPLCTAVLSKLLPLKGKGLGVFAISLQGIAAFAGIILMAGSGGTAPEVLWSATWFRAGNIEIPFGIALSAEAMLMVGIVQIVAFLVFMYAAEYMAGDSGVRRFWSGIALFTAAMNLFVVSVSTIQLFLAWELIGFASFVLIGHEFRDAAAGKAAGKAFLMNRIGDALMLGGILILGSASDTYSISETIVWLSESLKDGAYQQHTAILGGTLLLCGMVSKSAQVPLQVWLPDAMKGPTPVSALMHAATLVAAGIWLLFRFHILFQIDALRIAAILMGGTTFLVAGISACFQWDIKKILAYSTMGQLGLMVVGMGAGNGESALLHLWIHGLFKCGLFLIAGILIFTHHQAHHDGDANDIRNLSLKDKTTLPLRLAFIIVAASMAGIPGLSGAFGKEAILHELWNWTGDTSWHIAIFMIVFGANAFTGAYLFRLGWHLLRNPSETHIKGSSPIPVLLLIPVFILAILNIWIFVAPLPVGQTWLDIMNPASELQHPPLWLLFTAPLTVLTGTLLSWIRLRSGRAGTGVIENVAGNGFGFNEFWSVMVLDTVRTFGSLATWLDHHVFDRLISFIGWAFYFSQQESTESQTALTESTPKEIHKPSLSFLASKFDVHVADAFVSNLALQAYAAGKGMASLQHRSLQRNMILALLVILAIASIITYFAGIFNHG